MDNNEDIIDSRQVIERLEELTSQWAVHANDPSEPALDEDEIAELETLRSLVETAADYSDDWEYGATLIRDSYFKEYAMDLAEELDLIPNEGQWPASCIDWDQAARELQMDYTAVDFDGVTYWVR